jgi:hypothetical protein
MRRAGTLVLTHSSRRTNPERASVQFLTRRFGDPGRLDNLPPFESLRPPQPLYSGALSFHAVFTDGGGRLAIREVGRVRDREKIQHAVFLGERDLLVGYEQRIERWRLPSPVESLPRLRRRDFSVIMRLEHPLLAGLHTVEPVAGGRAVASCSASDALLLFDPAAGTVETVLPMPEELYGRGYALGEHTDLRRHYVSDDRQRAHVNAASADRTGRRAVVSTLIQGAVGVFDLVSGEYREIVRGYVGCHGARFDTDGAVYFADSGVGALVHLDREGGIARRFAVGSLWLHDVQQVEGSVYAFALADANELRLYDTATDTLLHRRRFLTWPVEAAFALAHRLPGWLGNSTQALSYRRALTGNRVAQSTQLPGR